MVVSKMGQQLWFGYRFGVLLHQDLFVCSLARSVFSVCSLFLVFPPPSSYFELYVICRCKVCLF